MIVIILLLLIVLSSCANTVTENNLSYDLPNEIGTWVNITDTSYKRMYYLVDGKIYVTDLDDSNYPTFAFIRESKLPFISNVDVGTFEANINNDGEPYARDKNYVYYPSDADCVEFYDGEDWGCAVFFGNLSIKGADPYTFQYIGNGYAIDKNNMYFKGKCIPWNENIIKSPSSK